MKVRNGFVSNSSSSSFCLFGIEAPSGEDYDSLEEKIDKSKMKLEFHSGISDYSDDSYFIGLTPTAMKDDETLLQFKQRIVDALIAGGIEATTKDVKFYSDAGYNG